MSGSTSGGVRILLRIEGLSVLVASLLAYSKFGERWGVFVLFFLAPDLSFVGYIAGPRVGALSYNFAHSTIGPLVLLVAGVLLSMPVAVAAGIIWLAHIGFDRVLGYGLKYFAGFANTHIGIIGQRRSDA